MFQPFDKWLQMSVTPKTQKFSKKNSGSAVSINIIKVIMLPGVITRQKK